MNKFGFLPSEEELRQDVLRIIRNTPNKELAAFNIVTAIFKKLAKDTQTFAAETRKEMKASFAKMEIENAARWKEIEEQHKASELELKKALEELEKPEEGEEWKSR